MRKILIYRMIHREKKLKESTTITEGSLNKRKKKESWLKEVGYVVERPTY